MYLCTKIYNMKKKHLYQAEYHRQKTSNTGFAIMLASIKLSLIPFAISWLFSEIKDDYISAISCWIGVGILLIGFTIAYFVSKKGSHEADNYINYKNHHHRVGGKGH